MIDVETIFDSDREEYEFMQENKAQPMKEQIEKKAIVEMAKIAFPFLKEVEEDRLNTAIFGNIHIAQPILNLYKQGYRKQEWISVDERLPDGDERVLVYLDSNRSYVKIDTDRIRCGRWVRWGNDVTHWMPLPEAPKMKGGAE